MKIMQAKFGFDEKLKPTLYVKCKLGINEEGAAGKFGVTFSIINGHIAPGKTKKMLIAVEGEVTTKINPNTIMAIAEPIIAVDWVKGMIEEKRYHWVHTYYSDVEKVDKQYDAFMMPFDAEGYNEIPDIEEWKKMLNLLEENT